MHVVHAVNRQKPHLHEPSAGNALLPFPTLKRPGTVVSASCSSCQGTAVTAACCCLNKAPTWPLAPPLLPPTIAPASPAVPPLPGLPRAAARAAASASSFRRCAYEEAHIWRE
eukprot:1159279-Pelagomonas_calceolata.AAC.16